MSRRLVFERITDSACSAIGTHPDFVTVTIKDVVPDNYMRGRIHRIPANAPDQPDNIVSYYLRAVDNRDQKIANTFLSKNFEIVYPRYIKFKTLVDFFYYIQN